MRKIWPRVSASPGHPHSANSAIWPRGTMEIDNAHCDNCGSVRTNDLYDEEKLVASAVADIERLAGGVA